MARFPALVFCATMILLLASCSPAKRTDASSSGGEAKSAEKSADAKRKVVPMASTHRYSHDGMTFEGQYMWSSAFEGQRPGVVIYHAWKGPGEHETAVAEKLASAGYLVFIADMYGGSDNWPETNEEAAKAAGALLGGDRAVARARARLALDQLKNHKWCNGKTAAIGFCMGGAVALELARSGAYVSGVCSLHGSLNTPNPKDAENIIGKVLVLHGADDPMVPDLTVRAFQQEMRAAGVDWTLVSYGDAVHSFSNPWAGDNKASGNAYHPVVGPRSIKACMAFLKEVLGQ